MRHTTAQLVEVAGRLQAIGCVAAEEEAGELLAAAGDRGDLEAFLRRRSLGEPLAWIVGSVDFAGRRVRVEPGVYVPRFESTELARRAAHALADAGPGARAADICTGSGAVASLLIRAVPEAVVVGVDLDPRAARCAQGNGVPSLVADAGAGLRPAAFDVVTAVTPYVPRDQIAFLPADVQRHEPRLALDGGADGLEVARRVIQAAAEALRPGGWLFLEVGGEQDRLLGPILAHAGFENADSWSDSDGDLRGLSARRPPQISTSGST